MTTVRLASMLLLAAVATGAQASPPGEDAGPLRLRLRGGDFRPRDGVVAPPAWFRPATVAPSESGASYPVAILRGPLGPAERSALAVVGAHPIDYLPERGYRLRLAAGAESRVRDLPFVAWVGELPAHIKVDPSLVPATGGERGSVRLRAVLFAGERPQRVLAALAGADPRGTPAGPGGAWRVEAVVPAAELAAALSRVAVLPEVEAVEPVRRIVPHNQDAVWVHQSFVGPSPQQTPIFDHGIFGCGEIVGLADTGQDFDLCYFSEPAGPPPIVRCIAPPCPEGAEDLSRRKDILYYNWSGTPDGDDDTCPALLGASGHGTHTSGTVAADNAPFADCTGHTSPGRNAGDGNAPGARLVIQEIGDGAEYLNSLGGTLWNLLDVAWRDGVRIHSDSWGGACQDAFGICIPDCTIPYDSFARDADLAMWTHPDLLLVFSAGNAGDSCAPPVAVSTPGTAKSAITVGALEHGAAANDVPSFSSPGPVFDGRLKPTLAAQGVSTVSAASDPFTPATCDTCSLDGTSMAAPTVAGLAALVREYYRQGYHAAGLRDPGQGIEPSAALLKATLIDSAADLDPGAPGPDFHSGFGRVQLDRTLPFAGAAFTLRVDDRRDGIATGSVVSHAYDVSSGAPLRATLVWTDYPAALLAATARVNELRLEVVDPAGTVWFQTLDGVTGLPRATSNPLAAHDPLNVEERLVFEAPAAGRWIVRVVGVDVPWEPQPFALVVRGALGDCPAPPAPSAPALATPADHQVALSWSAVPGAVAYNVYRSQGSCPGGPWVPVAVGIGGASFLDTTVSGGAAYAYQVAATSDAAAACESLPSACASVVPTGDCTLAPRFDGIVAAASAGLPGCAIDLAWNAARPACLGGVRYNVYRGTSDDFPPDSAHRIARCVTGTGYTDAVDLVGGTVYHYLVRAEDSTTGHGGPCQGGNEEGNLIRAAATPDGPPEPGTWTDDAGDSGNAAFALAPPWGVDPVGGTAGSRGYSASSQAGICADLTSPTISLDVPGAGPLLGFATRRDLEYDPFGIFGAEGSLGQVEIATGPSFSNWTRVPLVPDYPALVEFPLNECATTAAATTYFSGIGGFTNHTASLANWAGGDVRVRFRLAGDYLYPGGSWQVDDVAVSGALVPSACASTPAGPPPIPDGASVPGAPLRVAKGGTDVGLTWDALRCPAVVVNVYRGAIGDYATILDGWCGYPATGSAMLPVPDNSWFLVVATDGGSTDGSWSRDGAGAELDYTGAGAACPAITAHSTSNGCP